MVACLSSTTSTTTFCFVPGGRVEYGENAIEALGREVREELGKDIRIGRLVLVADNLFEMGGEWFQEITLYFLIDFLSGSLVFDRDGPFEGSESGTIFQWLPLDEVAKGQSATGISPKACDHGASCPRISRSRGC